jgi:hypothetical protein
MECRTSFISIVIAGPTVPFLRLYTHPQRTLRTLSPERLEERFPFYSVLKKFSLLEDPWPQS